GDAGRLAAAWRAEPRRALGRGAGGAWRRGREVTGAARVRNRLAAAYLSPDLLDLRARLLRRAAVVDDVVGAAALLVDGHLGTDHGPRSLLREAATLHQTLDLHLLRRVHEHHAGEKAFEPILIEQRHVLHHHLCAAFDRLGGASGHPLAYQRMDDGVQSPPRLLVVEHQAAEPLAVDATVPADALPELAHHRFEARRARLVDGVAGLVGVDDRGSQLAKDAGHRRLARTDAACQADQLQRLRIWNDG